MDYPQRPGVLCGVQLEIQPGEIVGLVGESGSGKSTLALAILGLLKHTGARVRGDNRLLGQECSTLSARDWRRIRGRTVSLVPQSPTAALNPALRLGSHLREAWRAHSTTPWSPRLERAAKLLEVVGLTPPEAYLRRFPSQISIGQAQRLMIVMALLHSPALVIADEPTASLDAITQREILALLLRLSRDEKLSMLLISHDLLTVAASCNKLAILHEGKIVEYGPVQEVLRAPRHAYTAELVKAMLVDLSSLRFREM